MAPSPAQARSSPLSPGAFAGGKAKLRQPCSAHMLMLNHSAESTRSLLKVLPAGQAVYPTVAHKTNKASCTRCGPLLHGCAKMNQVSSPINTSGEGPFLQVENQIFTSPHHLKIRGLKHWAQHVLSWTLMVEHIGNFQGILKIMYMPQAWDKWGRILEDLSIGTSLHPRKPELCHRAMADLTFLWNSSNYHWSQEKLEMFPSSFSHTDFNHQTHTYSKKFWNCNRNQW